MSIIHIARRASVDEIAREMDRRGDVIESLEATIASLRKRVEELEGALEPFKVMADYHDDIDNGFGINRPDDMAVKVHLGHLRRARAALRAKGGEHGE